MLPHALTRDAFSSFSAHGGFYPSDNSTRAKDSILDTRAAKVEIDLARLSWHLATISWSNSNRYLATRSPLVLFTTNHCSVVMGGAYFPECQVRVSFPSGRRSTHFLASVTSRMTLLHRFTILIILRDMHRVQKVHESKGRTFLKPCKAARRDTGLHET